jgi:hypothetical protein
MAIRLCDSLATTRSPAQDVVLADSRAPATACWTPAVPMQRPPPGPEDRRLSGGRRRARYWATAQASGARGTDRPGRLLFGRAVVRMRDRPLDGDHVSASARPFTRGGYLSNSGSGWGSTGETKPPAAHRRSLWRRVATIRLSGTPLSSPTRPATARNTST